MPDTQKFITKKIIGIFYIKTDSFSNKDISSLKFILITMWYNF